MQVASDIRLERRLPASEYVVGHASVHELQHLAKLAREVDELSSQDDTKRYTDLHRAFHQEMAACCRCDQLYNAVDQCHAFATLWLSLVLRPSGSNARHQELVEAIDSRDPIKAEEAVTQHLALGMCPGYYIPLSELQAYTKKALAENLLDQQVRDIEIGKAHIGIGMTSSSRDRNRVPS